MKLNLKKPIIFFDLETTGTNIMHDRIVELSYIKVYPDGKEEEKTRRLNPEMPIPPQATAVHHITDEDVKDAPTFRQIAKDLLRIFENCDIAGFNSNKFDVPLLMEEFLRCGLKFDVSNRKFVDVQTIFHKMEQRTLVAAYKFYCDKELTDAHSALADTRATYEVLKAQLDRYQESDVFGNDIEKLANSIGRNYRVRVVTSDSLIQLSALRSGVLRMSAREFRNEVESILAQIRQVIEKMRIRQLFRVFIHVLFFNMSVRHQFRPNSHLRSPPSFANIIHVQSKKVNRLQAFYA